MGIKKGLDHSWKAWGHWNNVKELLSLLGYWPFISGGSGGALTFFWTAADGWSAPGVWLASLTAAALCAIIFAAIRIAFVYQRANSDQPSEPDDAFPSLRDQNAATWAAMSGDLATAMDGAIHRLLHGSGQIEPQSALRITFGNDPPYKYGRHHNLYQIIRTVCFRIENTGRKTLTECKITVEDVEPKQPFGWPISIASGITLAPGEVAFLALVKYGEAAEPKKFNCANSFTTIALEKERPFFDSDQTALISLKATGIDTLPYEARCKVWIDEDGKLQVEEAL